MHVRLLLASTRIMIPTGHLFPAGEELGFHHRVVALHKAVTSRAWQRRIGVVGAGGASQIKMSHCC